MLWLINSFKINIYVIDNLLALHILHNNFFLKNSQLGKICVVKIKFITKLMKIMLRKV